jgi:hypothetical protein
MKAFVFHSSDDLIEIISMDQNPIHIINTVKANHIMVCREINTMRIESPLEDLGPLTGNHYIELHKTKRFSIYS